MSEVIQNESMTMTIILEDGAGELLTDVNPDNVIVFYRKFGGLPQEKTINSSNFRELSSNDMPGLYEIELDGNELDTLGEMIVQIRPDVLANFETTHLRFEVTESADLQGIIDDLESLGDILTSLENLEDMVTRVLGLSKENFRITSQVYNDNDQLEGATLELYEDAAALDALDSPMASYDVDVVYDVLGRVTEYTVTRAN